MALKRNITQEEKNNAIDILVTLIVEELSEELKLEPDEAFSRFIFSKTGELLYNEESKLWWNGPSYIVDLYKEEISS